MNSNLSIGIDLGVASVGWAVYDLKEQKILEKGVYLFREAEKAEDRREKRGVRRRKKRKNHRVERLYMIFKEYSINEKNTNDSNLLMKRINAIREKVDKQDIVNIIMYFARHRGYIPFKDDDERKSEIIDKYREEGLIACEMQEKLYNENQRYRGAEYLIQHSDYIKELEKMLNVQTKYYKEIDEIFIKKVKEVLNSKRKFWEGPGGPRENQLNKYGRYKTLEDLEKYKKDNNYNKYLFENLIGNCSIYKDEKKASASNYYAECFNFYNDMINLRINIKELDETNMRYFEKINNEEYKLKRDSIVKIKDELLNSKKASYSSIFKNLFLVNLSKMYGYKKDKEGNPVLAKFEQLRKIKNKLDDENLINELLNDLDAYNKAMYLIQVSPDKKTRYEILNDNLKDIYSQELILKLSNHNIENKYHSFSEKALKVYLELMEKYNENSSYIERNFADKINSDVEIELINSYLDATVKDRKLKYINQKFIDDIIASPATKKSLRKAISILNKLFKKYDYPNIICIENTKEMLSADKQKEYEAKTLDNQVKRKNASKKLAEAGFEVSNKNIDRYLLLSETNFKCAYCNKDITVENCEIEHILPISKTSDDTFINKTASCTQCNSEKRDRTPYEFLINKGLYDDYRERVIRNSNFVDRKKENLLFEGNINKYEKKFVNRNLNDTAYATNELANQINLFKKAYYKYNNGQELKTRILKVPGQFTGIIRRKQGIEKDRGNKCHHAVDAVIISNIPNTKIGKLMDVIQNEVDKYWKTDILKEYRENLYDNLFIRKEVKEELLCANNLNTRFAQEIIKNSNGQLFDADISKLIEKDGKYYKIQQINNIYELKSSEIEDNFKNNRHFLCQDNNPELYKRLYRIIDEYKGLKVNPFVEYCKENNTNGQEKFDYRKHGIKQSENGSIVIKLRYMVSVTAPYIYKSDKLTKSNKINKKESLLMYDSIKNYCVRIFKNKENGKLLFMPISKIFVDNKGTIRVESEYYKRLYEQYVGKSEVEYYMDLFNNEYVKFYIDDKLIGEGLVGGFDKTNNKISIKNSNRNISQKINRIEKINYDVLGLYNLNIK